MGEHRFFSQSGEDCLLWSVFENHTGYYVDVGAFDGIHLSNSYSFELGGWQGLCIEAHPRFAQLCRSNRPNASFAQAACVGPESPAEVTFLMEPLGLLSGIRADLTEGMERRYERRGMTFEGFEEVQVATTTLTAALTRVDAPQTIDFISIDVEGTEIDVLRGLDVERFIPEVLIVEGNTPEADKTVSAFLTQLGYFACRRLGQNTFFAPDGELAHKLATTPIDCDIEDSLHPDGEHATHPTHRERRISDDPSAVT